MRRGLCLHLEQIIPWMPRWSGISLGLLLGLLVLSSCAVVNQPPPSAPVAPNASRITAQVQAIQYLQGKPIKRLNIEVLTSEPLEPGLMSLVRPGDTLWASTTSEVTPELLGTTIQATVRLIGDERGQRFWVSGIRVLNQTKME